MFLSIILSGDFPGFSVTGIEEDSPIVLLALLLHRILF